MAMLGFAKWGPERTLVSLPDPLERVAGERGVPWMF